MAGLFVFAMLFTIGTGFFVFVNNMNTAYVTTLSNRADAMQQQLSESLKVAAVSGPRGHLTLSVTNVGGLGANVTDILVIDPAGLLHGLGLGFANNTSPALPASVNVALTSPSLDTGLTIVPGSYTIKVLTQRGNDFVTSYPQPMTSSIMTLLSSFVITAGSSVFDTATLSGVTPTAGGHVTFNYFSGGLCRGNATVVSTVTVTNGVVPNSDPQTFNNTGSFSWDAVYSGDPNNSAATSLCEPLGVSAVPNCVPSPANICLATVSQGLGSISIDFNSFRYYSYIGCPTGTGGSIDQDTLVSPTSSCSLNPSKVTSAPTAYSISSASWSGSGGVYHAFSVNVTNADPQKRTMVLDAWTQLWFADFNLGLGGGRSHSEAYGMVLVKNSAGVPSAPLTTLTSTPKITIPFGETATLFFAINEGGDPDNFGGGNATPIFMLYHGTLGGQSWAENFPLTATFWLP